MKVKVRGLTYLYSYAHEDKECMICGDIATFTYRITPEYPKGRKAEITLCDNCLKALEKIDRAITKALTPRPK
jgi:hypothetical protein